MKLALNGATTMKADLATDIKAASAAGFDHLEIWASKLREFLKTRTSADLKTLFDKYSLTPYSINSIERITFRDERGHSEVRRNAAQPEDGCGRLPDGHVWIVQRGQERGSDQATVRSQ